MKYKPHAAGPRAIYRSACQTEHRRRRHAMLATALQLFGGRQGHIAHPRQCGVLGAMPGRRSAGGRPGRLAGETVETRGAMSRKKIAAQLAYPETVAHRKTARFPGAMIARTVTAPFAEHCTIPGGMMVLGPRYHEPLPWVRQRADYRIPT